MASQLMDPTIKVGDEEATGLLKKQLKEQNKRIAQRQHLGDKILMYIKSAIWVGVGIATVYYSNFFHHFFRNPKISPLFFQVSMAAYTIIVLLILYTTFILPVFYKIQNIEQYNPKLIPIGAITGVVAVISLLISIWPVWGFTSILIFIALWKGFFAMSTFLPGGHLGSLLFLMINAGTVLSFYIIQHEGYFH